MKLNDAQRMAREFPDFEAPSHAELGSIKTGDAVKVSNNYDRFWVRVTGIDGQVLRGSIDNDLVGPVGHYGDLITFEKRHVYEVDSR